MRLAAIRLVAPHAQLETLLGDQAIFEAVLAALGLPRGWQKKLARAFGNPGQLKGLLEDLSSDRQNGALPDRLAALVAKGDEAELGRRAGTGYADRGHFARLLVARRSRSRAG